jgi:hypothetical protein
MGDVQAASTFGATIVLVFVSSPLIVISLFERKI